MSACPRVTEQHGKGEIDSKSDSDVHVLCVSAAASNCRSVVFRFLFCSSVFVRFIVLRLCFSSRFVFLCLLFVFADDAALAVDVDVVPHKANSAKHTHAHTRTHTLLETETDTHANAHANAHANTHAKANTHASANTHANANAHTTTHTDATTHTTTKIGDEPADTIALLVCTNTHSHMQKPKK